MHWYNKKRSTFSNSLRKSPVKLYLLTSKTLPTGKSSEATSALTEMRIKFEVEGLKVLKIHLESF